MASAGYDFPPRNLAWVDARHCHITVLARVGYRSQIPIPGESCTQVEKERVAVVRVVEESVVCIWADGRDSLLALSDSVCTLLGSFQYTEMNCVEWMTLAFSRLRFWARGNCRNGLLCTFAHD